MIGGIFLDTIFVKNRSALCDCKNLLGHCFSCSDAFVPDLSSDRDCVHMWDFFFTNRFCLTKLVGDNFVVVHP